MIINNEATHDCPECGRDESMIEVLFSDGYPDPHGEPGLLCFHCHYMLSGEELDGYMKENKYLVNMMLFFKIVNLPALGRLNLRFLIEGKHLCYKCKKDLGRFALKFSVSDCRKRGLKMPKGLTTHDDICADCFDALAVR